MFVCEKHRWRSHLDSACPECAGLPPLEAPMSAERYLEQLEEAGVRVCPRCTGIGAGCRCKPDPVNHPAHYTSHPSGVECIQVVEHMPYNLGVAMAYLWRCDLKGKPVEDMRKAVWHIQREIERRERGK